MTIASSSLVDWQGFHGLPNFADIEITDFKSIFEKSLSDARAELDELAGNKDEPTIENFLIPLELCGRALDRVTAIFYIYASVNATPPIQKLEELITPELTRYHSEFMMNEHLFAKIDQLKSMAELHKFDSETCRVIELTWKAFVLNGSKLAPSDKARLSAINERLSILGTKFGQNVLNDEKDWLYFLQKDQLAGLPNDLIQAMQEIAKSRGKPDCYALSLARSIIEPFLTFSSDRELRELGYKAWIMRGDNANANDNREIIKEIISLRNEKAKLLGYQSFAHLKLDVTMAKTPENVMQLLMPVWQKAKSKSISERLELEKFAAQSGNNTEIAAWDWRFYAQKLKAQRFDFDEKLIKPYFPLDQMIAAAFDCAGKLFGLNFKEVKNIALWHEEARAFVLTNANNEFCGLFIGDYFARPTKRSGAWMSGLQSQHKLKGGQHAIVYNICNFAKPAEGEPALLSLDDAKTLFHEFGHALHGLLSNVTWPSISGTAVARDFVELPSQLYEHWLTVPEVLEKFAINYKTGEPLPPQILKKILDAEKFNAGFNAVEFLSSALMDMVLHDGKKLDDIDQFEKAELENLGMPNEIAMRHRPTQFNHIFYGDGYAAGYYSYLWAEVLDADAFNAFKETGNSFDPKLAAKLKQFIYSAGGSRDPAKLYEDFRGRLPSPQAMISQRGLD